MGDFNMDGTDVLQEKKPARESKEKPEAGANKNSEQDPLADASQVSSQGSIPTKKERRKRRGHEVWLHIYDLDTYSGKLNDYVLRPMSIGAFHCGVEVLHDEWFFACGDTSYTGVLCNEPKGHQVHVYKESMNMGESPLSEIEVRIAIEEAMDAWPANTYHPIHRNCVNFAEDLCQRLQVPETFPAWVRGAPDLGKNPILSPIADWGWRWVQWYNTEAPPPEEAPLQGGPHDVIHNSTSASVPSGSGSNPNGAQSVVC